jgi:hypothetical protein
MLMTVTNATTRTINKPDFYLGYPGVPGVTSAVGGNVTDALPHPFGHIGPLASGANLQLPVHPRDWRYKAVPWLPQEPGEQWNQLVKSGIVTLAFATEVTTAGSGAAAFKGLDVEEKTISYETAEV